MPVATGTLRRSGHVQAPKIDGTNIVVILGYGGPAAAYAFAVHENPRAGQTAGVSPLGAKYKTYSRVGQWKYLEIPLVRSQEKIKRAISSAVGEAFRRG